MTEKQARFDFDPTLSVFFTHNQGMDGIACSFNGRQSVKHLVESLGVPHTEIAWIEANGMRVGFDYLVQGRDQIWVAGLQVDPVEKGSDAKFVLDSHLGGLAAYLRMLGFNTRYQNNFTDPELAEIAVSDGRILLTRDRRLLMRCVVRRGFWVRSKAPRQQVKQVLQRYQLVRYIKPFQRCLRCNGVLEAVEKEAVLERLQPLTKKYYDDFRQCTDCAQIYWQGSHFEHMRSFVDDLKGAEIE